MIIMEEYIEYIKEEKKLTKNSLEAYIRDVLQFKEYLNNNSIHSIIDTNKTVIITYLLHLQKIGKARSTISRNLASIRCLYQYLLNHNMVKEDPTFNLKSPKPEKKIPSVLKKEEINLLLGQPDTKDLKGSRDKAMLELLYATGLRVSEIIALNYEDINLDLGFIYIRDEKDTRVIPISNVALNYLVDYISNYRTNLNYKDPVFINMSGSRLSRQGFWKIIKTYTNKAGIEKTITPQTLRHSFAVHLINNGADIKTVQEILGHSDISTTQVYSFASREN